MSSRPTSPSVSDVPTVGAELELAAKLASLQAQIDAKESELKALNSNVHTAKFEANVRRRYADGKIHCNEPRHFVQVSWPKGLAPKDATHDQLIGCKQRSFEWIMNEMKPFAPAKCQCERDALRWRVNGQYPGITSDQWVLLGNDHKGVGKREDRVRYVLPLPFQVSEKVFAQLHQDFPAWYFVSTATTLHDHGLSHARTMMAVRSVLHENILRRGSKDTPIRVLDLHGSAKANAVTNKHHPEVAITTACKVMTPNDEIRRVKKWGPETQGDNRMWYNTYDRELGADGAPIDATKLKEFDVITMFHVIYYYTPAEIAKILSRCNDDCVVEAIFHRFDQTRSHGELNDGELKWRRDPITGWIKQINNLTDAEKYSHMDTNWLFTPDSKLDFGKYGLTWDLGLVCPDTYKVTLKLYNPAATGLLQPTPDQCSECSRDFPKTLVPTNPQTPAAPPAPRAKHNSDAWIADNEMVIVSANEKSWGLAIPKEYHYILTNLRTRLASKPRTAQIYAAHSAFVNTAIKRHDAEHRKNKEHTGFEVIENLRQGSFWMDASDQIERDTELFNSNFKETRRGVHLYQYGHHGMERHLMTAALDSAQLAAKPTGIAAASIQFARTVLSAKV